MLNAKKERKTKQKKNEQNEAIRTKHSLKKNIENSSTYDGYM